MSKDTDDFKVDGLTHKQRLFCYEYLVDTNATKAAERAGYSKKTARQIGTQNLSKLVIKRKIDELMRDRIKRTEITADKVMAGLSRLGFSDIRGVFGKGDELLKPSQLDDDTAASIQSIKVVTRPTGEEDDYGNKIIENVHEIKLVEKRGPLELMGRHLGMFSGEDNKTPPEINIVINRPNANKPDDTPG